MEDFDKYLRPTEPVTLEDIENWERMVLYKFPKEYVDFTLKYNGALGLTDNFTVDLEFPLDDGHIVRLTIEQFVPFGMFDPEQNPKANTYLEGLAELVEHFKLSEAFVDIYSLLLFAEFGEGALYLCVTGSNAGKVYYADNGDFGIQVVADSFKKFLGKLKVHPMNVTK